MINKVGTEVVPLRTADPAAYNKKLENMIKLITNLAHKRKITPAELQHIIMLNTNAECYKLSQCNLRELREVRKDLRTAEHGCII